MARIFNFSAGPSTLPLEVLQEAADKFVDYGDADEYKRRLDELRRELEQNEKS